MGAKLGISIYTCPLQHVLHVDTADIVVDVRGLRGSRDYAGATHGVIVLLDNGALDLGWPSCSIELVGIHVPVSCHYPVAVPI